MWLTWTRRPVQGWLTQLWISEPSRLTHPPVSLGRMKLAVFEKALGDFRAELSDFDPALITSGDAARAFAVFTALEKIAGAARTLVAARATEAGDWKKEGHRSRGHGHSWVAEKTGSGFGEASGMLESSERLVTLPETTEAVRRGEPSGAQVSVRECPLGLG